ncbi:MAG: amidohydrolase family protein [Acidobacteria bacterium]|nr:amidohydrolase family protein [Acidobacteriota bacterium]MCI0718806.1 amidohydrolase family protein [Acidobacteriota bacterium]
MSKLSGTPFSRRRFLAAGSLSGLSSLLPLLPQISGKSIVEMARAAQKLEGVDIIDVHAHIGETPRGAMWQQGAEVLLEDMDRCGLGVAIISHIGAIEALTPEALKAAHDMSAMAARAHPRRLRSYLVFHPHQLDASTAEMKRLLESDSPFVGFKLHGAFHQYAASGPNYQAVFQFAHEHKLPVLFHVAQIGDAWGHGVGEAADNFPGMQVILAHLGPGEERLLALLKGRPNLYTDTCLSTGRYREVERIVRKIGAERVLFATDATYLNLAAGVAKIAFADIPEAEKRLIFGGNARRIFGKRLPLKL